MTIFRCSSLLCLTLLVGCGSSVDDKQTAVLVRLDQRVSNLEAAADNREGENSASAGSQPHSASDFMNIANNIAAEQKADGKQFTADQRLRDIEHRLDQLEEKQREFEMNQMAGRIK